jgi:hypothetical protein
VRVAGCRRDAFKSCCNKAISEGVSAQGVFEVTSVSRVSLSIDTNPRMKIVDVQGFVSIAWTTNLPRAPSSDLRTRARS